MAIVLEPLSRATTQSKRHLQAREGAAEWEVYQKTAFLMLAVERDAAMADGRGAHMWRRERWR
eukprot:2359568-Prymnesium_polylepis.1